MAIADLIWLFFLLSAIQPALQRRMLDEARTRVLHRLERRRGSRVIALIHRQETMSFLGFPVVRYLDIQDTEEILRAINVTPPEMPIDLIVHTPGGLVVAAEQVARALRAHPARVDDQTFILADVGRKALHQVRKAVTELLEGQMPRERAEQVAETLSSGTWMHDYPLMVSEAQALGLSVTTAMPEEVYRLMTLYPQSGLRRPLVEYVPIPYHGWQPQPAQRRAAPRETGQASG